MARISHSIRHSLEWLFFMVEPILTAFLYPCCFLRDRFRGPVRIPILMYHQVGRPLKGVRACQDCVSPERFEMQIRGLLKAGYRTISLAALARLLEQSSPARLKRCVVLTFDDGYRDQFLHAYRIILRYRLSATFFVVAGYLGKETFLPHLLPGDAPVRPGNRPPPGWLPLSWGEAEEMARHGMEIGSHSVSHRSLGRLESREVEEEIRRSKEILERRLGVRVGFFAYPFGSETYGDFDRRIQAILRDAGYRGACTTVMGTNGLGAEPFALRRIPMEEGDGPFRLRCKLVGAYNWVGGVKNFWQRLVTREDRVDIGLLPKADPMGIDGT